MINFRQVAKNVSFNWIRMAVGMILSFIQAPIVVNGLGNMWYGIWILIAEMTAYTWLFDLGIREAVVRYVSRHRARNEFGKINEIVSTAIHIYVCISVITIIVVSVLALLLPHLFRFEEDVIPVVRLTLFITGLNMAINWFFNAYVGILMGLQRYDIFQKIGLMMSVGGFFAVITLVKTGHGIVALSLAGFCGSMISNTLIYWQCKKLLPEFQLLRMGWGRMRFKVFFDYGKYVLLNNISEKIVYGADAIIIGIFLPVTMITFYAIAGSLINIMRNLVSSVTWVLNPLFSELESRNDMAGVKSILSKATRFSFLVGLPVGIVYIFMGKTFISLWMGKEYGEGSALVLIILTLATLFSLLSLMINSVLYGLSRHHIMAWSRVAEAVSKIVLCIIFIKIWGIVGVALGTGLAHILFLGVVLPLVTCRNLGISIGAYVGESILPPLVSSIPFALCCYLLNSHLPPQHLSTFFLWIALILPVFFVCAWYGAFTKTERKLFGERICAYVPGMQRNIKKITERP